jgi:hypothetical protein
MPYWSLYCLYCRGYIADALLVRLPATKRSSPAYRMLFYARPGAALACPYCNGLIGFDDNGQAQVPQTGWPVFRYGLAELDLKKHADGEPSHISIAEWALRQRFRQPGTQLPFNSYTYAELAPPDETVP